MPEISVEALALVDAAPDEVRAALADYRDVRPALLTEDFSGYEVLDGGFGAGSRVRWTLRPGRRGRRHTREWEVLVEESGDELVERDTRSDVVATWRVRPAPDHRALVAVRLSWEGPGGLAGFGERARAGNLRRVYGEVLHRLRAHFADLAAPDTGPPPGSG